MNAHGNARNQHRPDERTTRVALLIPDARRSLLAGLVDDAALLRSSPPTAKQAVDAYLRLRTTESGWMVGTMKPPHEDNEDSDNRLSLSARTTPTWPSPLRRGGRNC